MTCEISAVIVSDGKEVWVMEIPAVDQPVLLVPPACREIGTMHFVNGIGSWKCSEQTVEAACIMAAAVESFAQLVVTRLRERGDYAAWRQKILDTPSPPMMA